MESPMFVSLSCFDVKMSTFSGLGLLSPKLGLDGIFRNKKFVLSKGCALVPIYMNRVAWQDLTFFKVKFFLLPFLRPMAGGWAIKVTNVSLWTYRHTTQITFWWAICYKAVSLVTILLMLPIDSGRKVWQDSVKHLTPEWSVDNLFSLDSWTWLASNWLDTSKS